MAQPLLYCFIFVNFSQDFIRVRCRRCQIWLEKKKKRNWCSADSFFWPISINLFFLQKKTWFLKKDTMFLIWSVITHCQRTTNSACNWRESPISCVFYAPTRVERIETSWPSAVAQCSLSTNTIDRTQSRYRRCSLPRNLIKTIAECWHRLNLRSSACACASSKGLTWKYANSAKSSLIDGLLSSEWPRDDFVARFD